MSKVLLISDLHYTHKPNDLYRFELFEKVTQMVVENNIESIYVLGDTLDLKNNIDGVLLNRVVDGLAQWSKEADVTLIAGNHDLIDISSPYLYFVRHIPNVRYINKITKGDKFVFLPHTKTPFKDWGGLDFSRKIVLAHVSVRGAVYETGTVQQDGVDASIFNNAAIAFSGDIHSSQTIGPLTYVGCPYVCRYNDSFQGSCIILDTKTLKWERIPLDFLKRYTFDVSSYAELDTALQKIDTHTPAHQIKVRLHLDQSNMGQWRELSAQIKLLVSNSGHDLCHFELINEHKAVMPGKRVISSPIEPFEQFCTQQKITPELVKVGTEIMEAAV
jgi:calcineurin-like phosphoesterase family protein